MKTELVFHFLKFAIESETLNLGPWVERLYVSNDLTRRFPTRARRLRLLLERQDSAHALPIAPLVNGAFAETHLGLGPCYYAAGRFHSVNDGHLRHAMDYDLTSHTLRANVGGAYVHRPQAVLTYILRPILKGFLMPFYGLTAMHAAGLRKNGRTLLLAGGPAAGKTTTAIQLMLAGYDLLSDDRTFVTLDDDTAWGLSSLDWLNVSDNTLRLFPALRPHVVGERDEAGKWAVTLAPFREGMSWRDPSRITDFIQLERGPVARSYCAKLDRGRVLEDVLRETMIVFRSPAFRADPDPFRRCSEFILAAVSTLLRDARLYALHFADDDLPRLPALLDALGNHG